jgi:glycerol-3-phosphate acyltransferase PlsY
MTAIAAAAGYLIGAVPTAAWLARVWNIDLRREGSGNPGAKNALSTGGPALAAAVLLVEAAKGLAAVQVGSWMADDLGAVLAGLGAAAGNVYNVWYGFRGGKGLGISLGILLAAWPTVVVPVLGVIIVAAVITRSAGLAALTAMSGLVLFSVVWQSRDWPTGGLANGPSLTALAVGLMLVLAYKHWRDSPLNAGWRARSRAPV